MSSARREMLLWACALSLACLQMWLFTRGYRLSADDAGYLDGFMSGADSVLRIAGLTARDSGRIGMYLMWPLNAAGAYLAGSMPGRVLIVAAHASVLFLFARYVARLARTDIGLLMFTALLCVHPLAFEHMPPNAYPLQNTVPFLLILLARTGLLEGADPGPLRSGLLRALFVLAMWVNEYAFQFGTALVAGEYLLWMARRRGPGVAPWRCAQALLRNRAFGLDVAGVLAVLVPYLAYRGLHPSHYDGNQLQGIHDLGRVVHTGVGHVLAGTTFGHLDPQVIFATPLALAAALVAGALAFTCLWFTLPRLLALRSPLKWASTTLVLVAYVTFPLAAVTKQQAWCVDGGVCGYLDSRTSYFGVVLAMACVASWLLARAERHGLRRSTLLVLGAAGGFACMLTYAGNWRQAERMATVSAAWTRADALACNASMAPDSDGALLELIDPQSLVTLHPQVDRADFWKRYLRWRGAGSGCPADARARHRLYERAVERVAVLRVGKSVDFRRGGGQDFLLSGWSAPEPWGIWSLGRQASLQARLQTASPSLSLRIRALGHVVDGGMLEVPVRFNGQRIGQIDLRAEPQDFILRVPASALAATERGRMRIDFDILDPASPAQLGKGMDTRLLGIGLVEMGFTVE